MMMGLENDVETKEKYCGTYCTDKLVLVGEESVFCVYQIAEPVIARIRINRRLLVGFMKKWIYYRVKLELKPVYWRDRT